MLTILTPGSDVRCKVRWERTSLVNPIKYNTRLYRIIAGVDPAITTDHFFFFFFFFVKRHRYLGNISSDLADALLHYFAHARSLGKYG